MLNHRLQVLLDDERYDRVTALAKQRRVPVAEVVRDAIDRGLGTSPRRRAAALRRILAAPPMPVPTPAQLRSELDELRGRRG